MKHCRKEPGEPQCLSAFRAKNPAAEWERDFRGTGEGRACYETLRSTLRQAPTGLCAYCEIRLTPGNEQIAHFHPKSDRSSNHNWALDWDNLWIGCLGGTRVADRQIDSDGKPKYPLPGNRSCDEATTDSVLDGVILRPDEVPPFPRLFRFLQSPDRLDIAPDAAACTAAGIPVERVEATIEKLNLNCRRLAEARLPLHRQLEYAKKRLRESGADPGAGLRRLAEAHLAIDPDGCRKAFFTVARWSLHRYAEDHLRETQFCR
ncbi:retron system putative HNH endonuclease [uncultured Thiodictyon sp.]|uniref:retron system putative HNH endonuclease n=1 Tax=uncultured Thiodictyon sp. TaxID=1846217 RepID=UPI0025E18344|nr:retron system putative HNH endonuclease [uncultured Thiodictyon sp.]